MKKAVLFLIFNRLDTTTKVFEEIKLAKPPRLYIASDGARKNKENESHKVENIRQWVLNNVDWDCDVKTLFREENLGCKEAVSSAITWFFKHEEDGIILEDDCLPNQSFFNFSEELLNYYKNDKRIWHISGNQFIPDYNCNASYYFAKIMHCWGWASWADRWQHFKSDMSDYDKKYLKNFSFNKTIQNYWKNILNALTKHKIDTWDYQWAFEIVKNKGFCINPSVNLVSNIGFDGTHFTSDQNVSHLNLPRFEIEKITHPKEVSYDYNAIDYIYKNIFGIKEMSFINLIKSIAKKILSFINKKSTW